MTTVEPIRNRKTIQKLEHYLLATNFRNYVLFCFGINSGLRISDILNLNVIDVKNKNLVKLVEQKTGKHKTFPLNAKLKSLIKDFTKNRDLDEPLFKTRRKNRLDRVAAYRILNAACREMNIEENIGTHTLRKTFGYHFYKQYKDVAMLQKIFNHSSPSVTLRYIGIEQDEVYKSYQNFIL